MNKPATESFTKRVTQRLFRWRTDREIFERIFPHLRREKDCGYVFVTDEEMNRQTEELGVHELLDTIEQQVLRMPKAYGESFRHVMHRDLHERLSMYELVAKRRVKPSSVDRRFVATHA